MTRNPYADPPSFEPEPPPSRVSGLAVTSLVFGLLCCIPVVGIFAMILGGAGMVAISRSDGRLSGRGLATAGLVLGLLGTIWTGLLGLGTLQLQSQVQSVTGSYEYVETQNYAAFKNLFTTGAQAQMTDETIKTFHDKVSAAWGKHQGATKGIADIFSGYAAVGPQFNNAPQTASGASMPVPLKFDKGTALAFVQMSTSQQNTRGMPALENMVVLDPNGTAIWLLPQRGTGSGTLPPPSPPVSPSQPAPTTPPENPPGETPAAPPPTGGS
jgi:hypothetical protein